MKSIFALSISLLLLSSCSTSSKEEAEKTKNNTNYDDFEISVFADESKVAMGDILYLTITFNKEVNDEFECEINENDQTEIKNGEKSIFIQKKCTEIGDFTLTGKVTIQNDNKIVKTLPIEFNYTVAHPLAMAECNFENERKDSLLFANDVNVVGINIPGAEPEMLEVNVSNGSVKLNKGFFLITPKETGICTIKVYSTIQGERTLLAEKDYTVIE